MSLAIAGCGSGQAPGDAAAAGPRHTTTQTVTPTSPPAVDTAPTSAVVETSESASQAAAAGDFCEAVAALNEFPESESLTPAERDKALAVVNDLIRLWPDDTKGAAQTYFGVIRDAVQSGTAVDLDTVSEEFREAFATVFTYAADTCPGGFG
jgi:hypothetical protein